MSAAEHLSNAGPVDPGYALLVSVDDEMWCHDRLPPRFREAIQTAPGKVSAVEVYLWRRDGILSDDLILDLISGEVAP